MTPTQPSHAVEAVEREKFEAWYEDDFMGGLLKPVWDPERNCYTEYSVHSAWKAWQARAALASQQEVEAVGDQMVAAGLRELEAIRQSDLCADTELIRRILEAAARVPVASPAEPVPKLAGSPFESYVAQVIHAAFADGWGSCRDAEFAGDEAMNDAFNQSATLGVCLSIDGAGGAGVMDARPDSFHSDSGECDRVQRVELSGDELALFQQTLEDFADCGETETDYEVLVNWAQRGLLECINFQPTAAAHRMLAPSTSTDQKGNAA